ncbi:MAG: DUF116 domain-containing protein [Candidatus Brocadiia bacterium]
MGRKTVHFMNMVTKLRWSKCKPERLLILLPSCLQYRECKQKITNDIQNCQRCGRCKIKDLLGLSEKYGCKIAVATGGRIALNMALEDDIDAIVAVACEKELQEGWKGVFPKPILGVINIRPHGPCTDTDVNVQEVEESIRFFIGD